MAAAAPCVEQLEWRLLFTSLSGAEPDVLDAGLSPPADLRAASEAVELLAQGRFLAVLASPLAASVLPAPSCDGDGDGSAKAAAASATQYYHRLRASLAARRKGALGSIAAPALALEVLCLGVAALQAVAQANVTGPDLPASTSACPAQLAHPGSGAHAAWDAWAVLHLSADGEEVIGKTALPQYLVLACILLLEEELACDPLCEEVDGSCATLEGVLSSLAPRPSSAPLCTSSWWAARCCLLQQRLLARGAASLRASLLVLHARTLARHAHPAALAAAPRPLRRVAAAVLLEAALMEQEYRRGEAAAALLDGACAALRLRHALDGALGMRTVHQAEAKAQMVLRWALDPECRAEGVGAGAAPLPPLLQTGMPYAQPGEGDASVGAMLGESAEESDVLHAPRLTETTEEEQEELVGGALTDTLLPPLEAAAVLLCAICVRKGRAADELRAWEMAPFVEAVRAQSLGAPTLRAAADLLQARHERTRGRTRVRALSTLEGLVEGLRCGSGGEEGEEGGCAAAAAAARARLAWAAWLPPAPALRRELGEQLLAAGLVGAALELFAALELWDALVLCLNLAGKRAEAAATVRSRLEVTPTDARLWCALGDATGEEAHFESAWRVSHGRCARAQRSLARGAAARCDWPACAAAWRLALAVNPLHSDGWFGLGHACLQAEGGDREALQAFSRVTQQEPSHAEAWNNVAALSLRAGRRQPALAALQECVKHRREDWRVWDNMASVAAACCVWPTVAHAAAQLLRLTEGKRVPDAETLRGLCTAAVQEGASSLLFQRARDLLRDACAGGCGGGSGPAAAELWALSATLRAAAGEHAAAAECLVRRLRALQGTAWEAEPAAFEAYAQASCALAELHEERGEARDLASARLQLRGLIKRAEERFCETPLFARAQACLERIVAREAVLRGV